MDDEVIEALESTTPVRGARGRIDDPVTASAADTRLWRDGLLRFLGEIDENLTVFEVKEALESYNG